MGTCGTVVDLTEARLRLAERRRTEDARNKPEWGDDIMILAAYAGLVKAEHGAESARITFERSRDGITEAWWDGPEEIKERVQDNNRKWDLYRGILRHLAQLPARSRCEAHAKRVTIGSMWLSPSTAGDWYAQLRQGCIADDHLFPRSLKLGPE